MTNKFEELGIEKEILSAISELGFEAPMPVQEKVIPILLDSKAEDVIALAQTGTGKTAAFGLPIIQKTNIKNLQTQYLILSPTRELCLQIADDLTTYAKFKSGLKIAAVFGGANIERQISTIKRGVHIISATPGRLIDLIKRKIVDISNIQTVILDEADEMLNMGFSDDLEAILKVTPKNKNMLLFSATMSQEIKSISKKYMKEPVEITIGKRNSGAENVNHICYMVHEKDRYLALKRIVDFHPEVYGIIFCRTRKETQQVAEQLLNDGYNSDALHGDLSQPQRDTVMNKFRIKNVSLLVATDVAARGLDVENLTHIINYNLPDELEVYTHRSGRTGRAGKKGTSIVISNLKEKHKLHYLEKQLNKKFEYLPIPQGKEICEKQLFYLVDRMEKVEVDDSKINAFLPEIYKKLEWLDREELIKKFVSVEFNRFLDYYKNAADLNHPSDSKYSGKDGRSSLGFTRYFINLGNVDSLKPATLIGMINDYTGVKNIEIGDIEILKNFSFFETDSSYDDLMIKSFQNKFLKSREIAIEVAQQKGKGRSKESRSQNFDRRKTGKGKSDRGNNKRNDYKSFGNKKSTSSTKRKRKI